jgi:hypothetical protein
MLDIADAGNIWHIGHIIHHKNSGPDIYENLRPICLNCNKNDKKDDKTGLSSYHYMASIGTMLLEHVEPAIAKIRAARAFYEEDPRRGQCQAMVESKQRKRVLFKRCPHAKLPRQDVCGVHSEIKIKPEKSEVYLAGVLGPMVNNYDFELFEPEEQDCIADAMEKLLKMRYDIAKRRNPASPMCPETKNPMIEERMVLMLKESSRAAAKCRAEEKIPAAAVQKAAADKSRPQALGAESIMVKKCEDSEDETDVLNRCMFNFTFADEASAPDKSWMSRKGLEDINNSNLEEADWTANLASLADQARVNNVEKRSKNGRIRKRDVSEDP